MMNDCQDRNPWLRSSSSLTPSLVYLLSSFCIHHSSFIIPHSIPHSSWGVRVNVSSGLEEIEGEGRTRQGVSAADTRFIRGLERTSDRVPEGLLAGTCFACRVHQRPAKR